MELRPIADLEQWYARELTEAFPPNERKPLAEIRALLEAGRYEALGLYDGAALLGFANLWREPAAPGYVLLDYLGVTASRRNGGLGSLILRKLAGQCAGRCGVLTEAEWPDPDSGAPEEVLRRRRVGFYVRNGFVPVYEMAACGVRLQALLLGEPPARLEELMAVHRAIYGPARTDVAVPLAPGEVPPPSLFL